jgi:hypothetical protein
MVRHHLSSGIGEWSTCPRRPLERHTQQQIWSPAWWAGRLSQAILNLPEAACGFRVPRHALQYQRV